MFARREKLFTTPSGTPLDATNLDDLLTQALETAYPEAITPLGFLRTLLSHLDKIPVAAGRE